jgi:hypothetical protein
LAFCNAAFDVSFPSRRKSMLKFFGFALASLVAISPSACFAQGGFGPSPTPTAVTDPPGSVANNTAPAGQVNSWVSRFGDKSATALTITDTGAGGAPLIGTLRQYKSDGEGGVIKETFSVDPAGTGTFPMATTQSIDVIPIRLESRADAGLRYPSWDIVYDDREPTVFTQKITTTPPGTKVILGWVVFKEGPTSRDQSTTTVRFDRKKVKPVNPTLTDPCAGPPTDDIGEEEQFAASSKYTNAPGTALPPRTPTAVTPL